MNHMKAHRNINKMLCCLIIHSSPLPSNYITLKCNITSLSTGHAFPASYVHTVLTGERLEKLGVGVWGLTPERGLRTLGVASDRRYDCIKPCSACLDVCWGAGSTSSSLEIWLNVFSDCQWNVYNVKLSLCMAHHGNTCPHIHMNLYSAPVNLWRIAH